MTKVRFEVPGLDSFCDSLEFDPYSYDVLAKVRVGEKIIFWIVV